MLCHACWLYAALVQPSGSIAGRPHASSGRVPRARLRPRAPIACAAAAGAAAAADDGGLGRHRSEPLERLPALAGAAAAGFGRGSRQLGVPTANLPLSLFSSSEAERDAPLPTGVYLGWARLRGETRACVVNVGRAPTFEGREAAEKTVEAHLLHDFGEADFYGERCGLVATALRGYTRSGVRIINRPPLPSHLWQASRCGCCCWAGCGRSASSAR